MIVRETRPLGRISSPMAFPCLDPAYWPKPGEMISNGGCPKAYDGEVGDLGFEIVPKAVQESIESATGAFGKVPVVLSLLGVGGLVIFGSAVLPSDPKWLKYLRIAGIAAGIGVGYLGVRTALAAAKEATKPEGAAPGAGTVATPAADKDLNIVAQSAWAWLGAPRLDFTIYNKGPKERKFTIRAKNYLGKDPATGGFVFGWPDLEMTVPSGGKTTQPFYLVAEHLKSVPGERSAMFEIFDKETGKHVTNYPMRFSF